MAKSQEQAEGCQADDLHSLEETKKYCADLYQRTMQQISTLFDESNQMQQALRSSKHSSFSATSEKQAKNPPPSLDTSKQQ